MPILLLAGVIVGMILLSIAILPITLIQRYRVGTARRPARRWIATLNLVALALSTVLFMITALMTSQWVPDAFRYALAGLGLGCVLGLLGLVLTRWDATTGALYYTPNRWLVLAVTFVVTGRVLYGFWRSWQAWRSAFEHTTWVVQSGVAGSLAAGAVVLGYYLIYWTGVRRRVRRWRRV